MTHLLLTLRMAHIFISLDFLSKQNLMHKHFCPRDPVDSILMKTLLKFSEKYSKHSSEFHSSENLFLIKVIAAYFL